MIFVIIIIIIGTYTKQQIIYYNQLSVTSLGSSLDILSNLVIMHPADLCMCSSDSCHRRRLQGFVNAISHQPVRRTQCCVQWLNLSQVWRLKT